MDPAAEEAFRQRLLLLAKENDELAASREPGVAAVEAEDIADRRVSRFELNLRTCLQAISKFRYVWPGIG